MLPLRIRSAEQITAVFRSLSYVDGLVFQVTQNWESPGRHLPH